MRDDVSVTFRHYRMDGSTACATRVLTSGDGTSRRLIIHRFTSANWVDAEATALNVSTQRWHEAFACADDDSGRNAITSEKALKHHLLWLLSFIAVLCTVLSKEK